MIFAKGHNVRSALAQFALDGAYLLLSNDVGGFVGRQRLALPFLFSDGVSGA